jgi:hypothetical protein
MSKMNVTIPANAAGQAYPWRAMPKPALSAVEGAFGRAAAAFFLVFGSVTVKANLTSAKSNTYERHAHFDTRAVRA